jgi:hypothetical protein
MKIPAGRLRSHAMTMVSRVMASAALTETGEKGNCAAPWQSSLSVVHVVGPSV